jgi:flagellar hook assembly protein FlgD
MGEEGQPNPTQAVAVQRVDNYASGFLTAGARVVFALRIQRGANLVNTLFDAHTTMDGFFMMRFGRNSDGSYKPYYGWVGQRPNLYLDSARSPGARIHIDPDGGAAGTYPGSKFKMGYQRAVSGDLSMTTDEWLDGPISDDSEPPVIQSLSVGQAADTFPASETSVVFTPNGDGLSDTVAIEHTLSEGAYLEVNIRRPDGTLVKHFTTWADAGESASTWDGHNDAGKVVADGTYDINVRPKDRAGNLGAVKDADVKVLTALRAPLASPVVFYPADGDTLAQTSALSATLTKAATVTWKVMNAAGDRVRLGIDGRDLPRGPIGWVWDGLDDGGAPVPSGTYTAVVTASTAAGTYSHKLKVKVMPFNLKGDLSVVDGQTQTLTIISAEPLTGWPAIEVRQPSKDPYTLSPVRRSATRFTARWTLKSGPPGQVRITISGTDTQGGTQNQVYTAALQ